MRHSPIPRSLISALSIAVIGLSTTACAKPAPETSGAQNPSTSVAAPDVKPFVACMRSHGLPDFPEVTIASDGLVNFDIDGNHVDADSEIYGAAIQACQSLLPANSRLPGAPVAPPAPAAPKKP